MDLELKIAAILAVVAVGLISGMVYTEHQERELWTQFSAEHHCVKTGEMAGESHMTTGIGIMPNGQVGPVIASSHSSAKTGYTCDDGVTYWR